MKLINRETKTGFLYGDAIFFIEKKKKVKSNPWTQLWGRGLGEPTKENPMRIMNSKSDP